MNTVFDGRICISSTLTIPAALSNHTAELMKSFAATRACGVQCVERIHDEACASPRANRPQARMGRRKPVIRGTPPFRPHVQGERLHPDQHPASAGRDAREGAAPGFESAAAVVGDDSSI